MIELFILFSVFAVVFFALRAMIRASRPLNPPPFTEQTRTKTPKTKVTAQVHGTVPVPEVVKEYYSLTQKPFIIADVETTGLDSDTDEIIEIAALKYEGGPYVKTFTQLVKPSASIPKKISTITRITNDMVSNAPSIDDVMTRFYAFIGRGAALICHNASFDEGFIMKAARNIGLDLEVKFIDSLAIARKAIPYASSHKLSSLADMFGIDAGQKHRALDDCTTLMFVYISCQNLIELDSKKNTVTSIGEKMGGYSGITINKALIEQGFQTRIRDNEGKWVYTPTDKAKKHIIIDKSGEFFHWHESIIPILDLKQYKKKNTASQ